MSRGHKNVLRLPGRFTCWPRTQPPSAARPDRLLPARLFIHKSEGVVFSEPWHPKISHRQGDRL